MLPLVTLSQYLKTILHMKFSIYGGRGCWWRDEQRGSGGRGWSSVVSPPAGPTERLTLITRYLVLPVESQVGPGRVLDTKGS